MITSFRPQSYLNKMLVANNARFMSAASTASIRSRFETAYEERVKSIKRAGEKK